MTKEELLKRQEELTSEFNQVAAMRNEFIEKLKQSEIRLNQLNGAYTEIQRQLDLLEPKPEEKHEN